MIGTIEETIQETDATIQMVDDGADVVWKEQALEAVRQYCLTHPDFIVDQIWETGLQPTRENRAMGAVMIRAGKLGYCVTTEEYRKTNQIQCHRSPRVVWRSLICAK